MGQAGGELQGRSQQRKGQRERNGGCEGGAQRLRRPGGKGDDQGVCLGTVPSHWRVSSSRRAFTEITLGVVWTRVAQSGYTGRPTLTAGTVGGVSSAQGTPCQDWDVHAGSGARYRSWVLGLHSGGGALHSGTRDT